METYEILRRTIEANGDRRLARLLGYLDRSSLHRQARPTMEQDPEGTGTRNILDRVRVLVEASKKDPVAYEALRVYLLELLDEDLPVVAGPEELREHADALIRGLARLYVQPDPKARQAELELGLSPESSRTARILALLEAP